MERRSPVPTTAVKCQQSLVIETPSDPLGRDSHLDTKPSILENRSTKMIQFAQELGAIGLNMLATSNLRYSYDWGFRIKVIQDLRKFSTWG